MPSLRDIRNRIRSVKSTQKITRAMKLVAAAKLRRAQENILAARPYALEIGGLLHRVATRAQGEDGKVPHPLLDVREPKRVLLVVMTSDRGMCGGFNSNILRRAERFIHEHEDRFEKMEVASIGKKGREYFRKRGVATVRDFPGVFDDLTFRRATEIAEGMAEEYVKGEFDAVFLLYNEFKSAMSQRVTVESMLPIVHDELPAGEDIDYIYEPGQVEVLNQLAPRYVAIEVWRALLESNASEHGARMTAMENATKNAKELIDGLTMQFNRARQAAITKDLMDIVGGSEALR
ncbi:MAG: ATP synthase F1 subunit gamma [Deltaproteobacteria bacterium RIFOXYA12_FULL_58_15]|nr:MAG: ATP synthase F1 subunit gamma [Deltaproteobacteria bacterium RIFOXYA12_FULL_58_15]OGR12615.1 MAG: ATP synthase F1 subunit gamma [Deltaproteobacteria bacterium RIFOXYB12_FULL_58_9]